MGEELTSLVVVVGHERPTPLIFMADSRAAAEAVMERLMTEVVMTHTAPVAWLRVPQGMVLARSIVAMYVS